MDNRNIMRIALPAMAENFLQMLMGMIDGYLVARLGLVAISGVAVAGNIITIYQAIFIALGAAISSVLARNLGSSGKQSQPYYVTESLNITLLISGILGFVSLVFGKGFLILLGTEPAVAEIGGQFLAIVGGTIVLLGLMTSLGAIARAMGKPRLPMYVSLLINLLNALFSTFFIVIWEWGIVGVALGTVLARLVGVIILWKSLNLPVWTPKWGLDRELLRLAIPAAGERLMMRAGDVVLISLVVRFGTEAVAGNAIGEVLTQFNYMPAFGIATATVLLVAHARGEEKTREMTQLAFKSYWLALACMFPLALTIFLAGRPLVHLYTQNVAAVEVSLMIITFSLLGVPLTAGTVIYTAAWQGAGNAKLPFYATTIGMWLIRIGMGYLFGIVLNMGLVGIWIGTLLDNGFRWLFLGTLYKKHRRNT